MMKSPLIVCLLATSALAATPACAASYGTSPSPAPTANTMAATPAPVVKSPAPAAASSATTPVVNPAPGMNIAMLQIKQNNAFGKYLVDGNGRALYAFSADTRAHGDILAKSACTSACAMVWLPATVKNMPKSASGIESSEMSTVARADGIKQLTYDGQPLYVFARDQNGTAPKGQGIQHFGGTWHLVTPGGALDQRGIA